MKKIFGLFMVLGLFLVVFANMPANAQSSNEKEIKIEKAKDYFGENVIKLEKKLNQLKEKKRQDVTIEDIDTVIDKYYKENPGPKGLKNDSNLTIKDVYPEDVAKSNNENKSFVMNKFVNEKKYNLNSGEVLITFVTEKGSIDVFLSKLGIMILERKTKPSETDDSPIFTVLPTHYTPMESTTGTAYNAWGGKLFSLTAIGQFKYNGTTVSASYADGYGKRYFWGSTMNFKVNNKGSVRSYRIGDYSYSEVYTRAYVESVYGIRWAGLVLDSFNAEVYIGGTQVGNIYGSAVVR